MISKITNLIGEIKHAERTTTTKRETDEHKTASKTPEKVEVQLLPYPTPYEL